MCFVTKVFSRRGVVSTSPNPQAGGPPRVGFPRLLIQYIRSKIHAMHVQWGKKGWLVLLLTGIKLIQMTSKNVVTG